MHCGNELTSRAQRKAVDDDDSMIYVKAMSLVASRSILIDIL